ncbi:hypothetical protein CCH79_00007697 [Gambusia affinis]|uniref:Uncharacterized protein n=1 Tax=Gambusia affinis TaxID=33528 RepID=A0A315WCS5_GAMAF|nr:hypothetical protein CCH79_00007697 [Gambusia affinis]
MRWVKGCRKAAVDGAGGTFPAPDELRVGVYLPLSVQMEVEVKRDEAVQIALRFDSFGRRCEAAGMDLEELKGPFVDISLDVNEATAVPHPVHQVPAGVTGFKMSGEGLDIFKMSSDGWLYLEKPLDWSEDTHYVFIVISSVFHSCSKNS